MTLRLYPLVALFGVKLLTTGCVVEERTASPELTKLYASPGESDNTDDVDEPQPEAGGEYSELCQRYCSAATTACTETGEYQLYADADKGGEDACLELCMFMPPGNLEDAEPSDSFPTDNTVACRTAYAESALQGEANFACPAASPGGGGGVSCGSNCEAYCDLFEKICDGVDSGPFGKEASLAPELCLSGCKALADRRAFDIEKDYTLDNIQCRFIHLTKAAVSSAEASAHCWHARLIPPAPSPDLQVSAGCRPSAPATCDEYCDLVMVSCSDERTSERVDFSVYETRAQCLATCELFEPGETDDIQNNTVSCRRYHAQVAIGSPGGHCSHAGPAGDGHCGDADLPAAERSSCESYCLIAEGACKDEFTAEYPEGQEECITACRTFEGGVGSDQGYHAKEHPNDTEVVCRLRAGVRALVSGQCDGVVSGDVSCGSD